MGVIYLVRHGQANALAYGVDDAEADVSNGPGGLTRTGDVQAKLTGAMLAGQVETITAAISGDLPRQTQTLAGVLSAFDGAPSPIVDAGWNEYELPALVGSVGAELYHDGRSYQRKLDAGLAEWISAGEAGEVDGPDETYPHFARRIADAAARATELAGSGQTVLVVSSAGSITQWIAQLWDIPAQRWPTMARTMVNASVTKLIFGRSGVSLVSFNEHGHLADRDGGVSTFR
ncbi:Phosphoglycerate mutase [Gordonia bronchialis DSM 43247]|uniref:Phosphoglycerate mutase n=1 Tax=Gordonia bronchialis (strain ATCC 25592 / DSM 43247 / BCRC 13721 / JCM 3198 / KCTC 3076 / NBRC 16047 / NCTC 10667) TaxID=526226 RepID=D0L6T9_GORB4|nr:histidine phosphatase family protein [Gordonia bronchialis]ACY23649.1 Phosphoglycerate mutase [Gordonia bronchialis DSM 43247]MCC3321816.1 histidine phosphatase family protein [Gordonia bronchialis]QGS23017.1 histidine phosphatase family protein [Gordonia bronchialis]STQ66659.1 alpha-ribazole phosphatase [Gordonia bronchialis]